jgi:hypothetical protein
VTGPSLADAESALSSIARSAPMAKRPLRSQLNQIRAWVQEGRTDAWIAHQLELPAAELAEFKRRHGLTAEGGGDAGDVDLRDEIEAEIEAATREAEEEAEASVDDEIDDGEEGDEGEERDEDAGAEDSEDRVEGEGDDRPRRRRRRGGRGRGRGGRGGRGGQGGQRNGARATVEGTFDHGDEEGFGLWLDPAVQDDPAYTDHWAGHRAVDVVIEPDRIIIRRRD